MAVRLEKSWYDALSSEFDKPYFVALCERVRQAYQSSVTICPKGKDIFRALDSCPLDRVKVLILGQDPYHGLGQAEGLSFSVPKGVVIPPSLHNIKQEIASDLGRPSCIQDGHLMPWVEQGVLLLNATLTVELGRAGSHQGWGWEIFTDKVIEVLNAQTRPLVFLLWGAYARRKGGMINRTKHLVLEAPHPSPLSVYRGFFGCRHFSQTNAFLLQQGQSPIDW